MFKINNPVQIEPTEVEVDGSKRIIKSIGIDVSFSNATIDQRPVSEEEIRLFMTRGDDNLDKPELQKMKYSVTDTQIPNEARLFGKSLKVDIFADVNIRLTSYSEERL